MVLADSSSRAVVQHADTAAPVTTETWGMRMSVKLVLGDLSPAFPCLDLPSSATKMGNSLADTASKFKASRIAPNRLVARAWSKHSAARCLNKCCFLSRGPRYAQPMSVLRLPLKSRSHDQGPICTWPRIQNQPSRTHTYTTAVTDGLCRRPTRTTWPQKSRSTSWVEDCSGWLLSRRTHHIGVEPRHPPPPSSNPHDAKGLSEALSSLLEGPPEFKPAYSGFAVLIECRVHSCGPKA